MIQGGPARLLFDGRIDNRAELIERLKLPAEATRLHDSQIVLASYFKWGQDCLSRLLGEFSLAVWDESKRQLLMARDASGARPLFFFSERSEIWFCSDFAALVDEFRPSLNWQFARSYLTETQYCSASQTCYQGLNALSPGSCLLWQRDSPSAFSVRRFWDPKPRAILGSSDPRLWLEELQAILRQAISCRLRRRGKLACHLSGGLDSTLVTAICSTIDAPPLCLSYLPPPPLGPLSDDWAQVAAMQQHFQLECYFTRLELQGTLNYLVEDPHLRDPFASSPYEFQLQQRARNEGVQVILSGWGGDEAISGHGFGFYPELLLSGNWRSLYAELKALSGNSLVRLLFLLGKKAILPWFQHLFTRNHSQIGYPDFLEDAFLERLKLLPGGPKTVGLTGPSISVSQWQSQALINGHLGRRCQAWAQEGANCNLVYRYPLLDQRLVEFALSLPCQAYIRGGQNRWLFRQALRQWAPAQLADFPKLPEPSNAENVAVFMQALSLWGNQIAQSPAPPRSVLDRLQTSKMDFTGTNLANRRPLRRIIDAYRVEQAWNYGSGFPK